MYMHLIGYDKATRTTIALHVRHVSPYITGYFPAL